MGKDNIDFDIQPITSSIIMVVGVGGGGGNAVNHMYKMGINDVSFMLCNTDRQVLDRSPIPSKIRLGEALTEGLGAGNKPERGRAAAEESIEEIISEFKDKNIKMVFITAGMGGGTGTGAAPIIAKAAKELGILTVAIVTIPFKTEGNKRIDQALRGIDEIRHQVDSLLVINNENINEIHGELTLSEAFGKADDILATAARSIADIITYENKINVDFADVQTVMKDSGVALMGSAQGGGTDRALKVTEDALSSPLLNHNDISGAKNILLNITSGNKEVTLSETYQITKYIQEKAGNNADLIWGAGRNDALGDDICVTVIATGFDASSIPQLEANIAMRGSMATEKLFRQREDTGRKVVASVSSEGFSEEAVGAAGREVVSLESEEPTKKKAAPEQGDEFGVVTRANAAKVEQPHSYIPAERFIPEVPEIQLTHTETQTIQMSAEDIENIPAYLRRKYNLITDTHPEGGERVSRVTLKEDGTAAAPKSESTGLFD